MELDELLKLIQAVSDSDLTGFKYETEGVRLNLSKEKKMFTAAPVITANQTGMPAEIAVSDRMAAVGLGNGMASAISAGEAANTAGQKEKAEKQEGFLVKSPLVGTFYAAPAEDAAPYVSVGDVVKKGQTVAIVEAMKLMNDIESDFAGTVAEILVENGEMVEYGQPLFRIV